MTTTINKINYSNRKKLNKDFSFNDLKRSNCFGSNFTGSNFQGSSFKGAQFKKCNFSECNFESAEFVATNLRNSKFISATFKNVIFDSANIEGVDFEDASFENVIFLNTDTSTALNFDSSNSGIKVLLETPELNISERLERAIKASKKNEFIKKSGVLDTKEGKINPLSVMILLESFDENTLIESFSKLKADIDANFATLSYIVDKIKSYSLEK